VTQLTSFVYGNRFIRFPHLRASSAPCNTLPMCSTLSHWSRPDRSSESRWPTPPVPAQSRQPWRSVTDQTQRGWSAWDMCGWQPRGRWALPSVNAAFVWPPTFLMRCVWLARPGPPVRLLATVASVAQRPVPPPDAWPPPQLLSPAA